MSGSGRKRSSKWDLRDEPPFEDVNVASDSWPGKGGRSFLHRESRHGWQSPDLVGDNGSRWCALETNDIRSKHDSGFLSRENIPGSRGSHKSENIDKDSGGYAADSSWDRDGSYDSRMSPGLDKWRQRSHSQSPRAGWSRSLRGRTRSRSCSRSRSRSPVRGYRRDSGYVDRNRSRSGVSSKLCRDFAAGRCRRGDQCHFLHEGKQTYEDNWDGRHRKGGSSNYSTLHDTRDNPSRNERPATNCNDFVKGKCRRGASCRFDHHGGADGLGKGFGNDVSLEEDNDRRKRETSIEQGLNREPRRNSDIPCRFFAAGNCRNGRYCRFSHNSQASASPDRKYQDERRGPGQKLNYGDQMSRDSKWSDLVPLPTSGKLDENKNGNIGISEPRFAWSANDTGFGSTVDSQNKIYSDPAVGHEAAKCNDEEIVGWKAENIGASMAPSESRHTEDMSPDWNYSIKSSNCVLKEENSPSTLASEFVSLNDSSLTTLERSITQDAVALSLDTDTAEKTALHADLNISANNILSSQSFDQTGHYSGAFPPSVNTIGQNQVVIPTELQGGFLKIPEHKTLPLGGKCVSGRDFGDFKTPVVDAGIKMVTSEQLSELTNLSSSLAQLLGNGQLYAALNPSDSMGTSSFAKSEVSVQPIPVIESQKHYDPICDSKESKKPENSDNPPAILPDATIRTCFTVGKSEKEQNNLIESSFPGGPCSDDHHRSEISTKLNGESQLELKALSEVGMVNNEQRAKENIKSQEDSRKIQDNDPVEDKDGKDDGKKGKDVKVIRAFKFALAEFVKELLKPTWKDGQINKDAYKTIVKKVVDKVTGTLQGANIPQTQEKIDHYLSSSKPKLMKLVQAYVGKAQKG